MKYDKYESYFFINRRHNSRHAFIILHLYLTCLAADVGLSVHNDVTWFQEHKAGLHLWALEGDSCQNPHHEIQRH